MYMLYPWLKHRTYHFAEDIDPVTLQKENSSLQVSIGNDQC